MSRMAFKRSIGGGDGLAAAAGWVLEAPSAGMLRMEPTSSMIGLKDGSNPHVSSVAWAPEAPTFNVL